MNKMSIELKLKRLHPNAVIPKYAKPGDAGMDITAVNRKITDKYIEYYSGWALEVPKGYVCLIFPRSSVTNKDMMQKNSVGVLDSGYRGELVFRFQRFGEQIYEVGEKVGQIIILPYPEVFPKEVEELSETERGTSGFGSTGR